MTQPGVKLDELRILARRRIDPLAIAELAHFRTWPAGRRDARVLDDPRVSLYCLDLATRRAIFVETPAGFGLERFPFYFRAQFEGATRLFALPFGDFFAWANARPTPVKRTIALHSVGRCGSTLLSRMFGELEGCVSLSEPDVVSQLTTLAPHPSEVDPLLRASFAFYGRHARPGGTLVIKPRSFCINLAREMSSAAQPHVPLFLYRSVEEVVTSSMRAMRYLGGDLWNLDFAHRLKVTRPLLAVLLGRSADLMHRVSPWTKRFSSRELSELGAVGLLTLLWLSTMDQYLALRRAGLPMRALHYHDLRDRPAELLTALLAHCELPTTDLTSALAAMTGDSQEDSPISRANSRPWVLSDDDRRTIARVLTTHPEINRGDHLLPGTLLRE